MSNIKIAGAYTLNPSTATAGDIVPIARPGDTNARATLVDDIANLAIPAGGTTGQVLQKASDTDRDLEWATPSAGGGGLPLQLPIADGRYYTTPFAANIQADFYSNNNILSAIPFVVGEAKTWTALGTQFSTAGGVGALARIGIYTDSGGYPDALVVDSGNLDISSPGVQEVTISEALDANTWYWLAININDPDETGFAYGFDSNSAVFAGFVFGINNSEGELVTCVAKNSTFGALPDPFPAGGNYDLVSPYIWLRTGV